MSASSFAYGFAALLSGAAGGFLFYYLHAPLPWTLGPIAICGLPAVLGSRWQAPTSLLLVARPLVGVMAGSAFTPLALVSIGSWWLEVLFVAGFSVVIVGIGFLMFRYLFGYDRITAFIGAMPAGLAELTVIGGSLGGNLKTLVLIHSTRIVAVVFTIPILVQMIVGHPIGRVPVPRGETASSLEGWAVLVGCALGGLFLGRYLRLPGGVMVGALVLSALAHATGFSEVTLPAWLIVVTQIVIGASAGSRFAGINWHEAGWAATAAFTWIILLLAMSVTASYLSTHLFGRSLPTALLALSPGGMAEMMVVTYALGVDIAFVVTCQVCRSVMILILGPTLVSRFKP